MLGIGGGSKAGSSPGGSYPEVATWADLPAASGHTGETYHVLTQTGTWPFWIKSAGLWYSNGSAWVLRGNYPDLLLDGNFGLQNTVDGTKILKFDASDISGSTTRTLKSPDADGTLALLSTIPKNHEKVTFVLHRGENATTGTNKTNAIVLPRTLTIVKAYAYAKTAPVGASLIFDINKGGTSIWNVTPANRLAIASGSSSGTQTSFDTTSFAENDVLTIDIDQVGSGTAGSDITVEVYFEY